jgi:hypothetical protein
VTTNEFHLAAPQRGYIISSFDFPQSGQINALDLNKESAYLVANSSSLHHHADDVIGI